MKNRRHHQIPRTPSFPARRWIASTALFFFDPTVPMYVRKVHRLIGRPEMYNEHCLSILRQLLREAHRGSPYYRRILSEAKVVKGDNVDMAALHRVPLLTKNILRRHGSDIRCATRQRTYWNTSGGSTGEPVPFLQDARYYSRMVGDTILFSLLNGKSPGDKEVKLWGSERDIIEGTTGLKDNLINHLFNRVLLNSFRMSETDIAQYAAVINQARPVQIWAYVDSIAEVAKWSLRTSFQMWCPKNIIVTAGTVYPEIRDTIQSAFPLSRVLNQYGSREVGQLACQVGSSPDLFIMRHANHIELLDPITHDPILEPGVPGKVVVTNLHNLSMPLIRYDIGDIAEYAPSSIAGTFTHLTRVAGRDNAHFINNSGAMVHGEYFTHLFYHRQWLKQFQVVQTSPTSVHVYYVPTRAMQAPDEELRSITRDIKTVMSEDTDVEFIQTAHLDKQESGKYQFVRRSF